jgi:hypothetical protein
MLLQSGAVPCVVLSTTIANMGLFRLQVGEIPLLIGVLFLEQEGIKSGICRPLCSRQSSQKLASCREKANKLDMQYAILFFPFPFTDITYFRSLITSPIT